MMKLETMQAVVATVNDRWESPLADEILARWAHDAAPAKYWRASANFIFFFKRSGQNAVLRFNADDERIVEMIQAEIEYINDLARAGIRVAQPIRSLAGRFVESVTTGRGLFHAVAFEGLPGEQMDGDECTPERFCQWGRALGELHNASAQIAVAGRPTWREHMAMVSRTLPANEKAARQTLDDLQRRLSALTSHEQNFGLIHFDFELDNILWNGDQAGIIDFDDSASYWFAADIAFALRDLFGDSASRVDFQNQLFLNFVEGYRSARAIDEEELKLLPLFLRLHNLITFTKLYRALTPVNPAGELAWMAGLRAKLVAKMQFYREEFATPVRV